MIYCTGEYEDINTSESKCAEYNGYNTRVCNKAGMIYDDYPNTKPV